MVHCPFIHCRSTFQFQFKASSRQTVRSNSTLLSRKFRISSRDIYKEPPFSVLQRT